MWKHQIGSKLRVIWYYNGKQEVLEKVIYSIKEFEKFLFEIRRQKLIYGVSACRNLIEVHVFLDKSLRGVR